MSASPWSAAARPASSWRPSFTTARRRSRHYGLEVFDESRLEVTLIEAGPRILPALPERLAEAAREELEALGVRVLTGVKVTRGRRPDAIVTDSGERIAADLGSGPPA